MTRTARRPTAKAASCSPATRKTASKAPHKGAAKLAAKAQMGTPDRGATAKSVAKPLRQNERDNRKEAARPIAAPRRDQNGRDQNGRDQNGRDLNTREQGLAAVDHTLDLLDALARLGPVALATLEREAACPHAAAPSLLQALQARGLAIHSQDDGRWQLGPRWGVMQRAAHSQGALATACMPFLAALGSATGENVYLRTRDGLEAETIAIYQADPSLRVYTEVGKRGPLHAGPPRLLLAHAPEAVQTQVLSQRLARFTPATRTDPTWIAADLQRLRMRGYLITADEVNPGVASVSAPVRDASGQVIAVLILSAPSMRLKPPRPRQVLAQVVETAAQLSRALGGPASQQIDDPAAHEGPPHTAHSAASVPTSPASPAAWAR